MSLTDAEVERYSRQLILDGVGESGQARLGAARVLVVGAGALGSPVIQYLAASGVGHLTIYDGDSVELSNLSRQPLHGEADLGRSKAESAAATARSINSAVDVVAVARHLLSGRSNGVVAVGWVVGGLQATEALKVILGVGQLLSGRLLVYDGLRPRTRAVEFSRDPACSAPHNPAL